MEGKNIGQRMKRNIEVKSVNTENGKYFLGVGIANSSCHCHTKAYLKPNVQIPYKNIQNALLLTPPKSTVILVPLTMHCRVRFVYTSLPPTFVHILEDSEKAERVSER